MSAAFTFGPPSEAQFVLVDPRIDQLIAAVTELRKEIEALKGRSK